MTETSDLPAGCKCDNTDTENINVACMSFIAFHFLLDLLSCMNDKAK